MKLKTLILYCLAQGAIAGECPPVSRELTALLRRTQIRFVELSTVSTEPLSHQIDVKLHCILSKGRVLGQKG